MFGITPVHYKEFFKLVSADDQLLVWQQIVGSVDLREGITSPFRSDNNPDCFLSEYNGVIFFWDNIDSEFKQFTVLHAIAYLKRCHINEAATIAYSFLKQGIPINLSVNVKRSYKIKEKEASDITYVSWTRNGKPTWSKAGVEYWKRFGYTKDELLDVIDIHHYYINGRFITPDYPAFALTFPNGHFKIYQPYSENFKWCGTMTNEDVWKVRQGSSILIITKSRKDMGILARFGFDVDAYQSEMAIPNDLDHLDDYEDVFLIYDNTPHETKNALTKAMVFQAKPIFYNVEDGKDTADVYENKGEEYLRNFLEEQIYE